MQNAVAGAEAIAEVSDFLALIFVQFFKRACRAGNEYLDQLWRRRIVDGLITSGAKSALAGFD